LKAITRTVTVAAGRFAPGHLGELTSIVPFELVDAVLPETTTAQRQLRDLPSRVDVLLPPDDMPDPRDRLPADLGQTDRRSVGDAGRLPEHDSVTRSAPQTQHHTDTDIEVLTSKSSR
jgi:hypothetical protein